MPTAVLAAGDILLAAQDACQSVAAAGGKSDRIVHPSVCEPSAAVADLQALSHFPVWPVRRRLRWQT